jgi:hypothetical protein
MLPLYRRLAQSAANVTALIEFMVRRVTDKDFASVSLCNSILFTMYGEAQHRDRVLNLLTRYLLRVLRKNADQYSRSNLKNRLRGSQILSVLEKHDRNASHGGVFSMAHDFLGSDFFGQDTEEDGDGPSAPAASNAASGSASAQQSGAPASGAAAASGASGAGATTPTGASAAAAKAAAAAASAAAGGVAPGTSAAAAGAAGSGGAASGAAPALSQNQRPSLTPAAQAKYVL